MAAVTILIQKTGDYLTSAVLPLGYQTTVICQKESDFIIPLANLRQQASAVLGQTPAVKYFP